MMTTTAHNAPTVGMAGCRLSHGGSLALSPRFPRGGDRADRSRSDYGQPRMACWSITDSPGLQLFHCQSPAVCVRGSLHRSLP